MVTRKNKLTTVFDGDDRPFQKKIKRVQHAAKQTGAILSRMSGVLGGVGLSMGMARTAQHFDRIAKVAVRMNMSVESLQRLSHAAELSGSSLSQLQGIMTRLERRTGEALQNSTGSQAQRFRELNIEVEAFSQLSPENKIMAIADAFNALGGSEQSVASLMGLLDTEVRELIPLLQNGSKGIEDMVKGITVLSKEQIRTMEAANDGLTKLQQATTTFVGGAFSGLSQLFGSVGAVFRRPDLMREGGKDAFTKGPGDTGTKFRAYSYRSLFQTPENRALMEKHNTADLRIARKREQAEIEKRKRDTPPRQMTQEERGKPSEKLLKSLGIYEGTPLLGISEARGKPSEKLLKSLDFFLGKNPQSAIQESQTSGRFGEFVAAATLGSGRGRSVSQTKGIRIQGLDKSVLIQEAMKKALEDLVARTSER